VEASHFDAGTAYAAVNRNNHDDLKPHIFRRRDLDKRGRRRCVGSAREISFERCGKIAAQGLLYAGTEMGRLQFLSMTGALAIATLNMPMVAIHDLAIEQTI